MTVIDCAVHVNRRIDTEPLLRFARSGLPRSRGALAAALVAEPAGTRQSRRSGQVDQQTPHHRLHTSSPRADAQPGNASSVRRCTSAQPRDARPANDKSAPTRTPYTKSTARYEDAGSGGTDPAEATAHSSSTASRPADRSNPHREQGAGCETRPTKSPPHSPPSPAPRVTLFLAGMVAGVVKRPWLRAVPLPRGGALWVQRTSAEKRILRA